VDLAPNEALTQAKPEIDAALGALRAQLSPEA
jgi:hypothetical protein